MMIISEYSNIANNELTHWWYKSLHNMVYNKIRKYKPDKNIKILDAGCGTGGLLFFLQKKGYFNISGVELSEEAIKICKERNLNIIKVDIKNIHTYFIDNPVDVLICNDVLYFLNKNEQNEIILNFRKILKKDGIIIINLPAFKAFRGIHDLSVGIKERFTKKTFFSSFNCSGYICSEIYYCYFLASPMVFIFRYIQRCRITFVKNIKINSDLRKLPGFFNNILYHINKLENFYIKYRPFGSSLFIILKTQ